MEGRSGSIKEPIYYPPGDTAASGGDNLSADLESSTRGSGGSLELGFEDGAALRVPKKFITNWRQACDRTRDRTKDLLKRWRTVPNNVEELTNAVAAATVTTTTAKELDHTGWSVHVWTTWVSRFPSDESLSASDFFGKSGNSKALAPIQKDKFAHFFGYLLDHDKDGFISRKDFELFSERLRRFADWSWNGPEYLHLVEIEEGLADLFLRDYQGDPQPDRRLDLEDWLTWWARMVAPPEGPNYYKLPYWIKLLPKILFLAINNSGTGYISKNELGAFYMSVVGFDEERVNYCLDIAYDSMTSSGDHLLGWPQYQLVFANYLFARGPFGPGEHFLGMSDSCMLRGNDVPFPIDYSAMNTPKDKLEIYSPNCKTKRRSVMV